MSAPRSSRRAFGCLVAGALLACFALPAAPARSERGSAEAFPYRGAAFTALVQESYRVAQHGDAEAFYRWFEAAYLSSPARCPGREDLPLPRALEAERERLRRLREPGARTDAQLRAAAWLHRMIKAVIPRFSLDRGFEFFQAAERGERQCFLQSVLIAGLLQAMGEDAGVAMVFRNLDGRTSNNGHAVTLLKLASGQDLLVDASEPVPFARQQGLLVRAPGQHYVEPLFEGRTAMIRAYRLTGTPRTLSPAAVRPLDLSFIRSQFDYYRAERTPGSGLAGQPPTPEGLRTARAFLESSLRACPDNALARFALARVALRQRDVVGARRHLTAALRRYTACGWVPPGPQAFRAQLGPEPPAAAMAPGRLRTKALR